MDNDEIMSSVSYVYQCFLAFHGVVNFFVYIAWRVRDKLT